MITAVSRYTLSWQRNSWKVIAFHKITKTLYLLSFHLLWQTEKTDTNLVAIVTKAVFSGFCFFVFYDSIVIHYGCHKELPKNILCALYINQFDFSN